MPLDPIEFRIITNMQTALQSIRRVDGYHHDLESVAVRLDPNYDIEALVGEATVEADSPLRPFIVLVTSPDLFDYYPSKQLRLLMPFIIHAVNDSDPTDDQELQKTYFKLCADVETAIAIDVTRGALATDTRILEREMHEPIGQLVWSMIKGEIRLQRTYGAPNG